MPRQGSWEKCLTDICSHLFKSVLCVQNFPLVLGMKPVDCIFGSHDHLHHIFYLVSFSAEASLHLFAYWGYTYSLPSRLSCTRRNRKYIIATIWGCSYNGKIHFAEELNIPFFHFQRTVVCWYVEGGLSASQDITGSYRQATSVSNVLIGLCSCGFLTANYSNNLNPLCFQEMTNNVRQHFWRTPHN